MPSPPRPPSIDQGVQAFIWAVLFGAFIWAGLLAVGASWATSVLISVVCFVGIFLAVRIWGEEEPRSQSRRTRSGRR